MKNKFIFGIVLLLALAIIPLVSSSISSLGTFKQNECVDLIQTCGDCTYVNFTKVIYPDTTQAVGNVQAQKIGSVFNYTFCNTSQLGNYIVWGVGDVEGTDTVFAYDFEVTPSGFLVGENSAIIIIGSLIIMILMSLSFFFLGNKAENITAKITFFSIAGIVFLMVTLFAVVTIQQTLYGVEGIVSGMETFLFVVKTLVTIGGLAFGIVIFLIMMKAWKIKRGHIDDY